MRIERVVLDTNVLISAALQRMGPPRRCFEAVVREEAILVFSDPTWGEFATRLRRPRLDRFALPSAREAFIEEARRAAEFIPILGLPMGCRDPDDDKIVETALVGGAEVIVTGDEDLLAMPARPEFRVLTPRGFLDGVG